MRSPKKSASFGQRSFGATAGIKFIYRVQDAASIFRVTKQVGGFLKSLVILKRKHHDGAIVFLGN